MCLRNVMLMVMICGYVNADFNVSHLIRDVLLKNYDREVRPVRNLSHPVNVYVSIGLKSFIQLDMKTQTFVSFAWLRVRWYDDFLTWNLQNYPVPTVHMTTRMVWRPQLIIFNTVSDFNQLQNLDVYMVVDHDGQVTWYPGGLFQTFCAVDISRYPLDTQTCSIDVVSWTASNDLINGSFNSPAFEVSTLTEHHPEWMLIKEESVYTLRPSKYWVLSFKFTLKRKVMFYMMNIVLPIVLLSVMNCVVFLLPVDSGEKMTVSVTVFLSFTVFMSLIKKSLPQNSDSFCLFGAYVASQMVFSVVSTFMAAFIVFVSGKNEQSLASSDNSLPPSAKKHTSSDSANTCLCPKSGTSSRATLHTSCSSNFDTPPPPPLPSDIDVEATTGLKDSHEATSYETRESLSDGGGKKDRQPGRQPFFWSTAWNFLKNRRNLTAAERRLMSRALDKVCLTLTVVTSVLSFVVFSLLMIYT
ncbi:hypothetical protein ACOMHN_011772 [Nucella lapillus]